MIIRLFRKLKSKINDYKKNIRIQDLTSRYLADNGFNVKNGRILYDLTVKHTWLRNGAMNGIPRVCNELFIALQKKYPVVMVELVMKSGQPELHRIDLKTLRATEEIVLPLENDIFLTPELQIRGVHVPFNHPVASYMKKYGTKSCAIVYDILPVYYPDLFEKATSTGMESYIFDVLRNYDFVLCDSDHVCNTLIDYVNNHTVPDTEYVLSFNENDGTENHLSEWWTIENNSAWSKHKSFVHFFTCDIANDLELSVSYKSFLSVKETRVYVNNKLAGVLSKQEDYNLQVIKISKNLLNESGVQTLLLVSDNAETPQKLNISNDRRCLGISVNLIKIKSIKKNIKSVKSSLNHNVKLDYFHCGYQDFPVVKDRNANETAKRFFSKHKNTFLMVGTIEPRKGHEFVINVFKNIWKSNSDVALCIVGHVGWKMDSFVKEISADNSLSDKLLLLTHASDETLSYAYHHSRALIQASSDEGFGLPLIEAGKFGIPVICSDIPVFHEVAGENALYFNRNQEDSLMRIVSEFDLLQQNNKIPDSSNIKSESWDSASQKILDSLLEKREWKYVLEAENEYK